MYHLYAVCYGTLDEAPESMREWWMLQFKDKDKQTVVEWFNRYKRKQYKYKLVYSTSTLKDFFYPKQEILKSTSTSKMLKQVKYASN